MTTDLLTGRETVERLRDMRRLSAAGYRSLLESDDPEVALFLREEARKASVSVFGNGIFIRGLIEVSNHCRNNCLYCGLRSGNSSLRRFRLSKQEILECCHKGYSSGFRTFVLQGGEDSVQSDEWIEDLVRSIRNGFPDSAITLSLGEKPAEAYKRFKDAGANRYLLRHETFNAVHYSQLHPSTMSRERRLNCLRELKETGFQTGTGIMVGSPFQTVDNIVEDLLFIQEFRPEMVGTGPFIHHPDTPFAGFPDGSVSLTLKLISIFRLMNPYALIPATTALATLDPAARREGILCGANVVMPNLSPPSIRSDYSIYAGKAFTGAESAEGLEELRNELHSIGYEILIDRGDYKNEKTTKCITSNQALPKNS